MIYKILMLGLVLVACIFSAAIQDAVRKEPLSCEQLSNYIKRATLEIEKCKSNGDHLKAAFLKAECLSVFKKYSTNCPIADIPIDVEKAIFLLDTYKEN